MGHVRALARSLALAAWILGWYLLRLLLRPAGWLDARRWERLHDRSLRTWARGAARIIGMRVEVEGTPPAPPFVLVSNHLSYLDIIVLWTRAQGDFLAKAEVSRWPIFGVLTRSAGTLFVDRKRIADLPRVIEDLRAVLGRGRGVIVFPEGTSSEGAGVLRFRAPLFEAALGAGLPVHCAAISYRTPPGSRPARLSVCWWGDMGFIDHLYRVLMLPSCEARVVFIAEPARGETRKELAQSAQALVERHFEPVTGSPARP